MVIIRGGGSKTDLYALDNEAIARKIAGYRLPVWTGIGHEIDISVLDYVANRQFKTPTAVAEEIVARFVEMKRHLDEATNRFKATWAYRTEIERNYLTKATTGIQQGTRKLLDLAKEHVRFAVNNLSSKVKDRISSEKIKLSVKTKALTTIPINRINSQRERLQEKKNRLKTDTKRYLAEVKKEYSALASRFKLGRFLQRIESERSALKKSKMQLQRSYESSLNLLKQNLIHLKNRLKIEPILKRLDNERKSLRTKEQIIQALNPENNLKRGYSLVYNEDGTLVKSVKNVKKGTVVKTKTSDGKFESTIDSIES